MCKGPIVPAPGPSHFGLSEGKAFACAQDWMEVGYAFTVGNLTWTIASKPLSMSHSAEGIAGVRWRNTNTCRHPHDICGIVWQSYLFCLGQIVISSEDVVGYLSADFCSREHDIGQKTLCLESYQVPSIVCQHDIVCRNVEPVKEKNPYFGKSWQRMCAWPRMPGPHLPRLLERNCVLWRYSYPCSGAHIASLGSCSLCMYPIWMISVI